MAEKYQATEHARNYSEIGHRWAINAVKEKKNKKFSKITRLTAQRHLDDLKKSEKESYPYYFDPWHGNDICDFGEKMPHVEGVWDSPYICLEDVQIFILTTAFGWRRKADGLRRFTSVYIEMARKGAKSTITAMVSLYCLTCEGEIGPQILIGATTGDQAKKVFDPAKAMADRLPDFRDNFGVETWARAITCRQNGGYIRTINAKSSTQDGHNPHVGVLDELHAHKDRGLYDVIKSAFGSRKNPLLWVITTAGYNINGVCYEQRKLVLKILSGIVEADHYFAIIFTLDEQDDPLNPDVWIKANPMLGVTPTMDSMESYAKEAAASPETMGEFRTKRLNVWTTAKGTWLNMERWKRCTGRIDLDYLCQYPCYAGLDLSSTSDFTAFVLAWMIDGRLTLYPRFWLPEDVINEREKKASVPYKLWHDQGLIQATPGNVVDYDFIEKDIEDSRNTFQVKMIGYDRWNSTQTINNLQSKGAPVVPLPQGPQTFNPAMMELERQIKQRTLTHGGHAVLTWMASNVVARRDVNDNMAPDRKNSQEKIDGIVAALNAISVLLRLRETEFCSMAAIG